MPARSAASRASLLARTLKPMIAASDASASVTSDSVMPPTPAWMMRAADLVGAELVQRAGDRFDRALHVALDDQREFLAARGLDLRHHLLERAAHAGLARRGLLALLARAIVGDLAGARLAVDHREPVAGVGRAGEAEHLDRTSRARPR